LQEEKARVLAGTEVDEPDARGDPADSDLVERSADRAGDVSAMAALVDVGRVLAGLVGILLARAVDKWVVDREVATELPIEVRRDIG